MKYAKAIPVMKNVNNWVLFLIGHTDVKPDDLPDDLDTVLEANRSIRRINEIRAKRYAGDIDSYSELICVNSVPDEVILTLIALKKNSKVVKMMIKNWEERVEK